jgi:protocatechuate 3,4-dioxygenase beta subunit
MEEKGRFFIGIVALIALIAVGSVLLILLDEEQESIVNIPGGEEEAAGTGSEPSLPVDTGKTPGKGTGVEGGPSDGKTSPPDPGSYAAEKESETEAAPGGPAPPGDDPDQAIEESTPLLQGLVTDTKNAPVPGGSPGFAAALAHWLDVKKGRKCEELKLTLKSPVSASGKVVDSAGVPVDEALVVVISEPDQARFGGRFTFDKYWALTGPDGRFHLPDLTKNTFTFVAQKEGLPTASKSDVTVPAEEEILIELPAGSLLEGQVLDEFSGKPVQGAKVLAMSQGPGGFGEAKSDAEGRFRIENLGPGGYQLVVTASSYPTVTTFVRIEAGVPCTKEIRLKRGVTISGRVVEEKTGDPVPGVRVVPFGPQVFFGGGKIEAVSGKDGAFTLKGVSLSGFDGFAEDGAETRAQTQILIVAMKRGWTQTTPSPITVTAGQSTVENVEIRVAAATRVTGKVVGPGGRPVAGAEVTATSPEGFEQVFTRFLGEKKEEIRTDGEGKFEAFLRPKGRLLIHHPEHAFGIHEVQGSGTAEEVRGMVIRLTAGGSVEGVLLDERGVPLRGEQVSCIYLGEKETSGSFFDITDVFSEPPFKKKTQSDEKGRFTFHRLRPGRWEAVVEAATKQSKTFTAVEGGTESLQFRVSPPLSIHGIVSDAAGTPLEGVTLYASAANGRAEEHGKSGNDGSFEIKDLPPGAYRVTAWKQGYKSITKNDVQAGVAGLRIVMEKLKEGEEEEWDEWDEEE